MATFSRTKVYVQLDVFGAPVMNGVARHVHGGDVVAVSNGRRRNFAVQLSEQVTKPGALRDSIGDGVVLRFCT